MTLIKNRYILALFSLSIPLAQADTDKAIDAFELPEVEVIGATPLGASGMAKEKFSGNVQSAEDEDLKRHESLNITDYMRREMGSVTINDDQNNPYQPNVSYRGYFASPLLGTPIGLSVYQDGVRVNELFGDTVNWDLIPQNAIANMDLVPGSNPLFGLNTLGGALSIRTKSGSSHPGTRAQMYGGSFGRKAFEAEHGGSSGPFDWFFAGNIFEDDGWRPFTHSAVHQAFGKVGWENEKTDLDFSFTFANNKLNGIGPAAPNDYAFDQKAYYTARDHTENTLYFFNLKGSHRFTDTMSLTGNSYYRGNTVNSLNSNTSEDCESITDCQDEGLASAANVTGRSVQDGSGINLQINETQAILSHENLLTLGAGYNTGHTHFTQSSQAGFFDAQRVAIGLEPFTLGTSVKGENDYYNAFLTDTFSITPWMHINASGSWNRADVRLIDKIGTALNGNHQFERVNPSAGITFDPIKALELKTPLDEWTVYGNYNEGFRAPSPVELTCADPAAPCSLPNSFVADPPLKPVISKTFEVGMRGKFSEALQWSAALYHSRLNDDILFINNRGATHSGYFQNIGITQRQGGELGLKGQWQKLSWFLNYNFIDATYRTAQNLFSVLGEVNVEPGDRIPGIPAQTLKLGGEYEIISGWFFGGDLQYASSQYARGDDHNQYGQVQEYTIVNLNSRYKFTKNIEIFAMARNIFDTRYETFGAMNRNFFNNKNPERFVGPGAPISGWAGLRVYFD